MTRRGLTVSATAAVALAMMAGGQPAGGQGGILGSPHDFSQNGWGTTQVCIFCHTPHGADVTLQDEPLWNHELSTKQYALYTSSTLDGQPGQPDGASKLCLSCHDGTVAIDSYGGQTGSHFLDGEAAVGAGPNDLKDDHPVSFTYDKTLADADGTLFDPAAKNVTIGSGGRTKSGTVASILLDAGKVQCSSCHDVHNDYVAAAPLLKITSTTSTLCLSCHDK